MGKIKGGGTCCLACFLLAFALCFLLGVYVSFAFLPGPSNPLVGTVIDAAVHTHIGESLKRKALSWIPDRPDDTLAGKTPIAMQGTSGLVMCKLDFRTYAAKPYNYPMFKDLLKLSGCEEETSSAISIANLKQDIIASAGSPAGRVVYPTAFIFHESRVGSTLIANMLASDELNLVYSEADVPSSLFNYDKNVRRFRDTMLLLGRSRTHKRLFFKFQSVKTLKMDVVLQAFPDVPWIFIFRKPVQVMMSHMDPRALLVGEPPCLRSKTSGRTTKVLAPHLAGDEPPSDAALCAAHLSNLCNSALKAYESYGRYDSKEIADIERDDVETIKFKFVRDASPRNMSLPRGFFIDYDALPGIVPRILTSFVGVDLSNHWLQRMREVSTEYSKGRAWYYPKAGYFRGDSQDKDTHSSDEIRHWAETILSPSYTTLSDLAMKSYNLYHTPIDDTDQSIGRVDKNPAGNLDHWVNVKAVPTRAEERSYISTAEKWSFVSNENFYTKEFNPFESAHNSSYFEHVECPSNPTPDYPKGYPMKKLIDNWNPDDTEIPKLHYDSFCRFDFVTEMEKIRSYKKANVPFIIYNMPDLDSTMERWSDLDYLNDKLGPFFPYPVDTSTNNHFMYAKGSTFLEDAELLFNGPTGKRLLTFEQWLNNAISGHSQTTADRVHQYFRVDSINDGHWLYDELPYYKPHGDFFDAGDKGIHCRFGMKGVLAECHYDAGENYASSVGGLRRWIMLHPKECENLYLIKKPDVSARHSEINWSNPDYEKYPLFKKAMANELILQGGQILYVPSYWFHFIVSLNINFQCNCRSKINARNSQPIYKCMDDRRK